MNDTLKNFINNNLDLINQNTKESWAKIYLEIPWGTNGEFTEIILNARINDPASIMGYIPTRYLYHSTISDYKIPDNVTSIGSDAFNSCESLTTIEIPDNVKVIGSYAFRDCIGLMSVKIGASVMMISEAAFMSCGSLTSIEIPNSVTSIGDYAFNSCHGLISVIIPDSVTSIGEHPFAWCNNLKEINFKGTKKQAMKLGIGSKSRKTWRHGSAIEKIICSDGVIEL